MQEARRAWPSSRVLGFRALGLCSSLDEVVPVVNAAGEVDEVGFVFQVAASMLLLQGSLLCLSH